MTAFLKQDAALARERKARAAIRRADSAFELIERMAANGLEADAGMPYSLDGREWWAEPLLALHGELPGQDGNIYQAALQSSAQVGKTVNAIVSIGSKAIRDRQRGVKGWAGIYWPDMLMAQQYSQARVNPVLASMAKAAGVRFGGQTEDGEHIPQNATLKGFAGWTFVFMWLHGKGVDGIPAARLLVDEVRLADPSRVDRVESRLLGNLHRGIGSICYLSTAGIPGDAMSVRWRQSRQSRFHHRCACPGGVDLAMHWPECVGQRTGKAAQLRGRYFLRCPTCETEITDRGDGAWVETNPDGDFPGYSPNQLMTRAPVAEFMRRWNRADRNTQNFYNDILGLTYIDADAAPINAGVLQSNVDPEIHWTPPGDDTRRVGAVGRVSMGIDQRGNENYFSVSRVGPDGRRQRLWLEVYWGDDPFRRAGELMERFGVELCVCEPLPNVSEARNFANAFQSGGGPHGLAARVFLVHYVRSQTGDFMWSDRIPESAQTLVNPEEFRSRNWVRLEQKKALDGLADHWRSRKSAVPDPRALLQSVLLEDGTRRDVELCHAVYFDHLQRIAKRWTKERKRADGVDIPEETGIVTYHWVKLASRPDGGERVPVRGSADPHFAFADLMDYIAWTRLTGPGFEYDVDFTGDADTVVASPRVVEQALVDLGEVDVEDEETDDTAWSLADYGFDDDDDW